MTSLNNFTFTDTANYNGWYTLRIRNATSTQTGQKCWVKATYKAPEIVNTTEAKNKCACVASPTVEIEELNRLQLSIYPNPAKDELYYEFADNKIDNYSIDITDLTGKVIYSIQTKESFGKISVDGFDNGYYFFRISNGSNSLVVKQFVKN
jgi:alpha-amylase